MLSRYQLPILLLTVGAMMPLPAQTGKLSVRPDAAGSALRFTATASLEAGRAGRVIFFDGVTPIGTAVIDADGKAAYTVGQLSPGAHTLRGVVWGSGAS